MCECLLPEAFLEFREDWIWNHGCEVFVATGEIARNQPAVERNACRISVQRNCMGEEVITYVPDSNGIFLLSSSLDTPFPCVLTFHIVFRQWCVPPCWRRLCSGDLDPNVFWIVLREYVSVEEVIL